MKTVLAQSAYTIADYYFKYRQNYKGAKVFYNEAITDYPDSPIAAKARAKLLIVEAKLEEQEKINAARPLKPLAPKKTKRFWLF